MGPVGHGEALARPHAGLLSFQAAAQLGRTQVVKILTQDVPELILDKDGAKVAQMVVLEVFASNEVRRPFFTLGIVSSLPLTLAATWGAYTIPIHASCSAHRFHHSCRPAGSEYRELQPQESGALRAQL